MNAPRLLSLSVFSALAACASVDPASDWRRVQRERLDAMHVERTPEQILAQVLAAAPPASQLPAPEPVAVESPQEVEPTQDPASARHLDQRLPVDPAQGPRRFAHPWQPLVVTAAVGAGRAKARVGGTTLDDRTDVVVGRVTVDAGHGAALHATVWSSDDDLFAGDFISDGVEPRRADAGLTGVDLFPHYRFDARVLGLDVPVRLGAFADWQQLEHERARVDREWISFGPRVVVEPSLTLLDGDDGRLSLFARLGGDAGAAWFAEEYRNGDGRDTTLRLGGTLGGGLRARSGAFSAELGYQLDHVWFGGIDTSLYGDRDRTELQRQQVYVGFGLRY
jgi:hypothetical protein